MSPLFNKLFLILMCVFKSSTILKLLYCKGNQTIATGKTLHKAGAHSWLLFFISQQDVGKLPLRR
jgi:hypothetical protein